MRELASGEVFAGHRVQGVAGRGGMGVVYRAIQLDLDRTVALKLITPELAQDSGFRERFVRESKVAAAIDHPNVIPIYYTGEADGTLYIAMRYVEGDDLRTLVRREGRLEPGRAARIVSQVASALDAAHARGIVHRDVKPANVLLGAADHAYLTDFGLTKRLQSHTGSSRTGHWVGTLGYVAPEQIRGERIDARADVYALGCVLFHELTGAVPYQRESDEATLWAHLNDPPPTLVDLAPGVPDAFQAVIERSLAKHPEDRFPSAGDLGRAALAAAGHPVAMAPERLVARGAAAPDDASTVVPESEAPTRRARAPSRQGALRALGAAALGFAITGGALLLVLGGSSHHGRQPPASPTAVVTATPKVDGRPNDVVVAGGRVWVSSFRADHLTVLDASTSRRAPLRVQVDPGTASLAAGFGSLWVANAGSQTLTRISLASGKVVARIPLPAGHVVVVAVGPRSVWAGNRAGVGGTASSNVARIDPRSNTVTKTEKLPTGVQDLAVGAGAVWVVSRTKRIVTRIDLATGARRNVAVGLRPTAITVGAGAVWVADSGDDTLSEIDPASGGVARIRVGDTPAGVAVGGGTVWVANFLDATLSRIAAATGRPEGSPVATGRNPKAVAASGRTAWVADVADQTLTRVDAR